MARFQGLCLLVVLLSAACLSFAAEVERDPLKEDVELTGNGRSLKVLGALLLKKLLVGKAVVKGLITKAIVIKAKGILWKMKKVGLRRMLRKTGVDTPRDLATMIDLGKVCNVALDMGTSCARKAEHESPSIQKKLAKMHKVVLVAEGEHHEEHYVEYLETEVEHPKDGETEYYILEDDGTRIPYHPTEGDQPVEYVVENDDGSTSPYTGHVDVVTEEYHPEEGEVQYEVKDHAPDEAIAFLKDELTTKEEGGEEHSEEEVETVEGESSGDTKTVEFEDEHGDTHTVEVPSEGEYEIELVLPEEVIEQPAKEIAVDTVIVDGQTQYVRYMNQRKAGVKNKKDVIAFKLKMLNIIVKQPEFKKQEEILYARMLA